MGAVFAAAYLVPGPVAEHSAIGSMLLLQLGIFGLAAVAGARWLGEQPASWFGPPGALDALVGLGIGVCTPALGSTVYALQVRLVGRTPGYEEQVSDMLLGGGAALPVLLVVYAMLPAICEEGLFRGVLFAQLERHSTLVAVLGSSVVFGLVHLDPERIVAVGVVGLVFALARVASGTLFVPMAAHFMHNGLSVTANFYRTDAGAAAAAAPPSVAWWPLVVVVLGLLWLARPKKGT